VRTIRERDALADFGVAPFTAEGITHDVYRRGRGHGVVLLHEVPCITPEAANLARRIAAAGFTVLMPSLTGTPGRPFTGTYAGAMIARLCVSREVHALAARRSSPVAGYLRALCRAAHAELGGPGVGVIGMCMTGNFAIACMADASVCAPVTSQPSLPFLRGSELHLSSEELVAIKARAASGVRLVGLRFTHDPLCPRARFDRLSAELGDAFERIEIDSAPGNPHGHRRAAHSVLTLDFHDAAGQPTRAAMERVLAFLRERVGATPASPPAP
jgi:dienelactone hydrolase